MALNIDTIRSLDANKTYYLANSTGQIKEAGAWQKFKCFFGIGDARQKVQNLIDAVKIALLKEVGESDNAKLTADIKSYDDDRYIDLSASGRSLAEIANRFAAANAEKLASKAAKAICAKYIQSLLKDSVMPSLPPSQQGSRPDFIAYLERAAKPIVDHPPMKELADGRQVLDEDALAARLGDALYRDASTDLVHIAKSERLGCPRFDKKYLDHVFKTLYDGNGVRNDKTIDDLQPALDFRLERARHAGPNEKTQPEVYREYMNIVKPLLEKYADDPDVLSIKITLYRMSASSKVAAALAYAADKGKDVVCLLELRARFDEQNNIDYSELLEDAGCRVVYGLPEHKVHSKLCVITGSRDGNIFHITQVGTGNYNEVTCEQYTDLALITADEAAGAEAEEVFASMINGELPPETHTLWIAPKSFKTKVMEYLDGEIAKGDEGHVAIKCNSMNNPDIMEKLIECSKAGVRVELFIRGICCLLPGIPGLTENITVSSIVGRWLEHSRIYSFGDGDEQRIFIGSGDLLNRNLERRVEAFIEVKTADTREQINHILDSLRVDREKSRTMQSDGTYIREPGGEGTSSQEELYRYFSGLRFSLDDGKEDLKAPEKSSFWRRLFGGRS